MTELGQTSKSNIRELDQDKKICQDRIWTGQSEQDTIEQNDRIYIKAKIINYQISTNLILEKTYFNSNLFFLWDNIKTMKFFCLSIAPPQLELINVWHLCQTFKSSALIDRQIDRKIETDRQINIFRIERQIHRQNRQINH